MTNTFHVTGSADWTQIAAGTAWSRVGVQIASVFPVHVFIGTAAPAAGTDNYIVLAEQGTRELDVSLASGDLIYARAPAAGGIVLRGFRESA